MHELVRIMEHVNKTKVISSLANVQNLFLEKDVKVSVGICPRLNDNRKCK